MMYHPLTARELAAAPIRELTVQAARDRLAAPARRRPGQTPAARAAAARHHLGISAVRADALFVSALQCCEQPSAGPAAGQRCQPVTGRLDGQLTDTRGSQLTRDRRVMHHRFPSSWPGPRVEVASAIQAAGPEDRSPGCRRSCRRGFPLSRAALAK